MQKDPMLVWLKDAENTFCRIKRSFLFHAPLRFLSAFSVKVAGCCRVFHPKGLRGLLGPNPDFYSMGVGQGTSWMIRQLIIGPLLVGGGGLNPPNLNYYLGAHFHSIWCWLHSEYNESRWLTKSDLKICSFFLTSKKALSTSLRTP